jgi:glycosyltransferase involved in cell wall biosynthesis
MDRKVSPIRDAILKIRKSLVYRLATHVVPVSAAAQKDLVETYNVTPAKCHVILNAMEDPGLFGKTQPTSNIVCSARFDQCKGQDVLIKAFAQIADRFPDAKLELLGSGKLEADCQKLTHKLGVADRCLFRGSVPRNIAIQKMAQAMIVVLPSRMDNCPLALIEAMAVGAPVVATNAGGIPEMVRDGLDGLLVPPDNAPALADKLGSLLSDPALRKQFSERARQRFSSSFEVAAAARRQVDWLEALLHA